MSSPQSPTSLSSAASIPESTIPTTTQATTTQSTTTQSTTLPRAMTSGTIKTYDASQQEGWIRPTDGSKDVHFHMSNLQKSNITTLFPGQKITFAVKESDVDSGDEKDDARHPIAVEVEAEDGHMEPRFLKLGH